ncbi:MAG: Na/Pi cotransporter family protein [Deltaproteobacteria bacterium]|nr:Na/Pi cotransporter family protein [Deltaproteobacteria bacterium]
MSGIVAVALSSLEEPASLDILALVMGLLGGLALFLFGMDQMAESLKAVAGDRLRTVLGKLTTNRLTGAMTGALVTAVIQSSSVTTVLVVGFITAGLMSMSQSVGIIMGANIGTTITAQIIAFKITKYALAIIAVGFGTLFFSRQQATRYRGAGLMGLGLVFFGMGVMSEAMAPLRTYEPFLDWMIRMENPLVGILAGAAFTALVQSSSATTGIVIVMASQGLITLVAGIALIFGSNIGTCITAILASIGKPREALRASVVHVLFNVFGVLLWVGFIDQFAAWVTSVSPQSRLLNDTAKLAAETPRQVANAHTIFNVVNTLVFLPFATQIARIAERLVPDRTIREEDQVRARFLATELLTTPPLALDRVRLELLHLAEHTQVMLEEILPAMLNGTAEEIDNVAEQDDTVDALHGKIIDYLGQISQAPLAKQQTEELLTLMAMANDLEHIGDIIETGLVGLARHRLKERVAISDETTSVIGAFHEEVQRAFQGAVLAMAERSETSSEEVTSMKASINQMTDLAARHQALRLVVDEPKRIEAYSIEMDILENLKRIYYFCKRIARAAVSGEATGKGDKG